MAKIKVKSHEGSGVIDTVDNQMPAIQITELGYVQVRVYYPKKGIWIKYNVCKIQDLLKEGFEIKLKNSL